MLCGVLTTGKNRGIRKGIGMTREKEEKKKVA